MASVTCILIGLVCLLGLVPPAGAFAGLRDQAQVYREEGLSAQRRGDVSSAVTCYQKAIGLDPGFALPHHDLGVLYESQGQLQMAVKAYERALSLDPNYLEASANLGSLYRRLGDPARALPRLLQAAVLFEQRGDLPSAKRFYQEVLEVEANHAQAPAGLAGVLERLGERDQAVTTWVKLALLLEQQGQLEVAKSAYARAAALDANSLEAATNLALLSERLGQRDEAVSNWVTVGGLDEQRGDLHAARRAYERALSLDPDSPRTLASLAVVSEGLGDRDQAVAYWVKCQQASSSADPWRLRAEARLVELGVIKTGPVYRGHVVEQELQANTRSVQQFRMMTDQWHDSTDSPKR